MIDLRSDTVTKPTPPMREAMAKAEVGDDVFGDDPTVHALEDEAATVSGKEAALFVSSGTMSNQLAIATQTRPGDEVIACEGAHPIWYETGAGPVLSGVQFASVGANGQFSADEMEAAIKPLGDMSPRTSLVCIENTHNRSGGTIFPKTVMDGVVSRARANGLLLHLDGARLWNASAATDISVAAYSAPFDTVSLCFSKGLGAPIGSALCGPRELIKRARRFRKMWGGGMRQSGIIAAGALYALRHHRARLLEDHANAKVLAELLAKTPGLSVDVSRVATNIVNIDLQGSTLAATVAAAAEKLGLRINASGKQRLRAVTHLDVTRADVTNAASILGEAVRLASGNS